MCAYQRRRMTTFVSSHLDLPSQRRHSTTSRLVASRMHRNVHLSQAQRLLSYKLLTRAATTLIRTWRHHQPDQTSRTSLPSLQKTRAAAANDGDARKDHHAGSDGASTRVFLGDKCFSPHSKALEKIKQTWLIFVFVRAAYRRSLLQQHLGPTQRTKSPVWRK